jgi:hypothetical protein
MKVLQKDGDRTAVIEARVDVRLLANLSDFFHQVGISPTSRNDLVKLSLELIHTYLQKSGKLQPYDELTYTKARDMLSRYGSTNRRGQNLKKLHELLASESNNLELSSLLLTSKKAPLTIEEWRKLDPEMQAIIRENEPEIIPQAGS